MREWENELLRIFDEPEFADIKPIARKASSGDRLVKSFEEISDFVEREGRLPLENGAFEEKRLYIRLQNILDDEEKRERCAHFDRCGIFNQARHKTPEEELEAIFEDELFDLTPSAQALFDIPDYMRKSGAIERPDYIAQRIKCLDFERYEEGFRRVHTDLRNGKRKLIRFQETHMQEGTYFVLSGILILLDKLGGIVRRKKDYKLDGRTRCIYENGTESDVLFQTLSKALYTDGYTVRESDLSDDDYLKKQFTITENDIASGYIYVLKSKSTDSEIASIDNLYKIGFTTQAVEERIANASNDATYLFADVEIVASWKVYNVKAAVFEHIIHKLFRAVQLQLSAGKSRPKEWFIVPYHIIEQAIMYIINGRKIAYDPQLHLLIEQDD